MNHNSVMILIRNVLRNLAVPLLLVLVFAMLILPLPPFLLDVLFTFNIVFALVILLACLNCHRPLDFGVFPSLILVATLLRLGLNVASTRIVLLNGHAGFDAAGKVIESFGTVVIGSNYTVGLVIFAVLVVVNFVVITKGANRVSEVSARFTLDSLPGKQLAIDSDLNAGAITSEEAKQRRLDLSHETDFYGSMDGASKFIRGDAIASLFILLINVIGGVLIGTLQHDMNFARAVENYVLLTIGDGLVAQIPALLLSTATALIVTRISTSQDLGQAVYQQLFSQPKGLFVTGVVIAAIAVFPGMPHTVFMTFAVSLVLASYIIKTYSKPDLVVASQPIAVNNTKEKVNNTFTWSDVAQNNGLEVQLGYKLICQMQSDDALLTQVKSLRKRLSHKLGFVLPAVRIHDNLQIGSNAYQLILNGEILAAGEIVPHRQLAIDCPDNKLLGKVCRDPIYHFPSVWIGPDQIHEAKSLGCALVDGVKLLSSHIQYIVLRNSHNLLGYEELAMVMQNVEIQSPTLYTEFQQLNMDNSSLLELLQNLLCEQVSISSINQILQATIMSRKASEDMDDLTERVRYALRNIILQNVSSENKSLSVIRLDQGLERILLEHIYQSRKEDFGMNIEKRQELNHLLEPLKQYCVNHVSNVLLVPAELRLALSRVVREIVADCIVISQNEVSCDYQLVTAHVVSIHDQNLKSCQYDKSTK